MLSKRVTRHLRHCHVGIKQYKLFSIFVNYGILKYLVHSESFARNAMYSRIPHDHNIVKVNSGSFLATDNDISLNKLFIFPMYT